MIVIKNKYEDETLNKLFEICPTLKINIVRNSKKDFSMCGYAYKVTLSKTNNSFKFTVAYNDSVYNSNKGLKPDVNDIMYCLLTDARCFECSRDFKDFCSEFGYSDDSIKALKIYKACKKTRDNLNELFNINELEQIKELYQDY